MAGTVVARQVRDCESATPVASEVSPAILRAFTEVAVALRDELELDVLLHLIADKICEVLDVQRCTIHLVDKKTGLLHGQVGRADHDIDARVKRVVGGLPADRLTPEIVRTRRPVFVPNAQDDPRPIRSAMQSWNVRSLLGVPMVVRGEVIGILYVDNEAERHDFPEGSQELAAAFAELAGAAVLQAQLTSDLRRTICTVERQKRLLRRVATIHEQLTDVFLNGANLHEVSGAVTELVGKPCAIYDASFERLALSRPSNAPDDVSPRIFDEDVRQAPQVVEMLSRLHRGSSEVLPPMPYLGVHHRFLVTPVEVDGDLWGYVTVMEYGTRLAAIDDAAARRVAAGLALDMSTRRRAGGADWNSADALARALVDGSEDRRSLEKRAEFLGIRLDAPRLLCLVAGRSAHGHRVPSAASITQALAAQTTKLGVLATEWGEGVALIMEPPAKLSPKQQTEWAATQLRAAIDELAPDGGLFGSVSTTCRRLECMPRASTEARHVILCMRAHVGQPGNHVLTADDLGAARLFLAATDAAEARRFCEEALGALLNVEDEMMGEMLMTLRAFVECSRSVRQAARRLDVHENTIRYRIKRVEEITGLELTTDAGDHLTAHIALLVLRLEGRLPSIIAGSRRNERIEVQEPVVSDVPALT